ncbi:hypothetical protein [Brevibacillus sp. MS2.2]|nr:hypothetical protein [Brevibacillus sp. MS2.2]NRR20633.1 hypothetical protein [Brevibacillus sp. MS2.2]
MSLSDIERKVLRVIGNYSAGRHRTPAVDKLWIKTGDTAVVGLLSF